MKKATTKDTKVTKARTAGGEGGCIHFRRARRIRRESEDEPLKSIAQFIKSQFRVLRALRGETFPYIKVGWTLSEGPWSPVTGRRSRSFLLLLPALALAGCSLLRHAAGLPPSLLDCPGRIVSTAAMDGDFLLRQRVRVRGDGVDVGFELVSQKKGAELTMVGLTSFGAKAFALTQKGTDVRVDSFLGAAWPMPPRNVLRDLNRMMFLTVPGGPFPNGSVEAALGGTRITEQWRDGELLWRSFRRVDGDPAGTVTVDFAPQAESGAPGKTARIRNGWCGYEATVFTVERRP